MISNPSIAAPHESHEATPSPSILIMIAWLIVLTPLVWGVYNTVKTSTRLFIAPPQHTVSMLGAAR